ncbi:hypothetical protein E2C01_038859 [Portunus trituberculatus]|uniref:Uncharacterized protein n=1 Tax=Portunus trituberculatus TaxID=210409 RepID=A0A5B7FJ33_PORTR|nr:hypothetical protein [Portunus trituberculatus]
MEGDENMDSTIDSAINVHKGARLRGPRNLKVKMCHSIEEVKGKYVNYEVALLGLEERLNTNVETGKGIGKTKLEEWRKVWKEQEEEKVNFTEVVKQQIREKTKDTVI